MEKQRNIDIFLADPICKKLCDFWREIAKEKQKEKNVFTLFAETTDYCLYQLLSENDETLRFPNVISEEDIPESINIFYMDAMDSLLIFNVWKNVQEEYKCPVTLTIAMSNKSKFEVKETLEKKGLKEEAAEFIKVLKIQRLCITEEIVTVSSQKKVLLRLCYERYKDRIHTDAIRLSREQMLDLQKADAVYWKYCGIAATMPDLIFGKEPCRRESQYGMLYYYNDQNIKRIFGDKIKLFVKYCWNDRNEFWCIFTPVVQICSLTISDVNRIFKILFSELGTKKLTTIKKYKFIEHFFECYVATLFKRFAECNKAKVKILWKLPNCMSTEIFSKLLQEKSSFFWNKIIKIRQIKNSEKIESNYFTDKDVFNNETEFFKLPTYDVKRFYGRWGQLMVRKYYKDGKDYFISIEKWSRFYEDYLMPELEEMRETRIIYATLIMEAVMIERGQILEVYFVRDNVVWHGFVPGEYMTILY